VYLKTDDYFTFDLTISGATLNTYLTKVVYPCPTTDTSVSTPVGTLEGSVVGACDFVLTDSGNVGIGTTSPDGLLDINGFKTKFRYEYRFQDAWDSNNNQTFTIPVTGSSSRGVMLVEAKVIQVAANSSAERVARVKGMISNYHTGTFYMTVLEGENVSAFETYIVGTSTDASGTFTLKYRPEAGYLQSVRCHLYLKIWYGGYTESFGDLTRTDTGSNSVLTAPTFNAAPKTFGGNVGIGKTNPNVALDVSGQAAISSGLTYIQKYNATINSFTAGIWYDIGDFSGMSNGTYLLTVIWSNDNLGYYWYGGASGIVYIRGDQWSLYDLAPGEDLTLNHWYHHRTTSKFDFLLDSDASAGNGYGNTTLYVKGYPSAPINITFTTRMTLLSVA
jgi:hypothetical protein